MDLPRMLIRPQMIGLALLLGCFAAVLTWLQMRDPMYSSPTAPRQQSEALFSKSWRDYTHETAPTAFPAAKPFTRATALHYPTGVMVNYRRGGMDDNLLPTAATAVHADATGLAQLPGGGNLRLAAFALSVPRADDPVDDETLIEPLVFRRPDARTALTAAELDDFGLAPDEREVSKALRILPMIRLVLASEDLPATRIGEWRVFDGRTTALITRAVAHRTVKPGVVILDAQLGIWHDTPADLVVELPCGQPVETPVPLQEGFETLPRPHLRFQLTAIGEGRVRDVDSPNNAIFLQTAGDRSEGTVFVHRLHPAAWAEHTFLRVRGEAETELLPLESAEIHWAQARQRRDQIRDVTLVHLPEKARAIFRVQALPEMPNGRDSTRNLFDVHIPRLALDFAHEGDSMLGDILVDLIAGATELTPSTMTIKPLKRLPADYLPKRFENVTPRDLAREYQQFAEDPYFDVDRTDHVIRFHRPEPWTLRVQQWWYFNAPDWAK